MTHGVCANCGKTARLLEVSADAYVDYYRCDACGEVWVHDRTNAPPQRVTIPKPTNDPDAQPTTSTVARKPGGVPFTCPRCHQVLEHVRGLPAEWDVGENSEIYRCPRDGYWRVHDTGRIEPIKQR